MEKARLPSSQIALQAWFAPQTRNVLAGKGNKHASKSLFSN